MVNFNNEVLITANVSQQTGAMQEKLKQLKCDGAHEVTSEENEEELFRRKFSTPAYTEIRTRRRFIPQNQSQNRIAYELRRPFDLNRTNFKKKAFSNDHKFHHHNHLHKVFFKQIL